MEYSRGKKSFARFYLSFRPKRRNLSLSFTNKAVPNLYISTLSSSYHPKQKRKARQAILFYWAGNTKKVVVEGYFIPNLPTPTKEQEYKKEKERKCCKKNTKDLNSLPVRQRVPTSFILTNQLWSAVKPLFQGSHNPSSLQNREANPPENYLLFTIWKYICQ